MENGWHKHYVGHFYVVNCDKNFLSHANGSLDSPIPLTISLSLCLVPFLPFSSKFPSAQVNIRNWNARKTLNQFPLLWGMLIFEHKGSAIFCTCKFDRNLCNGGNSYVWCTWTWSIFLLNQPRTRNLSLAYVIKFEYVNRDGMYEKNNYITFCCSVDLPKRIFVSRYL